MLVIMLSLPLLFLLERTPADAGVSIIVILCLINSFKNSEFKWLSPHWMQLCFIFSVSLALLALFSQKPAHAFVESLIWLRFPLFCAAASNLFRKYPEMLKMQVLLTSICALIMCLILSAELLYNFSTWSYIGAHGGRLTWPYGDAVSGNYFAKFCLCTLVLFTVNYGLELTGKNNREGDFTTKMHIQGAFILTVFLFMILTGERMNSIVLTSVCGAAFFLTCFDKPKILVTAVTLLAVIFGALIAIQPVIFFKFIINFMAQVYNFPSTGYWHLWATGIDGFLGNKLLGLGTSNFRHLCQSIEVVLSPIQRCDNHPHNFLIQSFAEGGLFGGFLYTAVITSIILTLYKSRQESGYHKVLWLIPFILFFPLRTNADLFGQWNNLMLWYSIAQALAISQQPKIVISDLFRFVLYFGRK